MTMLSEDQVSAIGFAEVGKNVQISAKASFYGASRIKIGNNVRIDDFCLFSAGAGGIEIGNYIHVAAYSLLIGAGKIRLSDFSGLSSRVSIYSSSDDYSGGFLTNPTVPSDYTNVSHADVFIGKHVIVGSGSVILPGVTLHNGVAIGALSLINKSCEEFTIYAGNPAKKIKNRKRDLLEVENNFLSSLE